MSKTDGVELGIAAGLPPKEAISYFESKGYKVGWNWYETLEDAHARAFTVAKCTSLDVLTSIRESLDNALKSGMTQEQFVEQLAPTLQKLGWWGKQISIGGNGDAQIIQLGSPRRLATIYQVNTRTAYAAGRYAEMMDKADLSPWWQYVAIMDTRTRATHAELNLMIFRYDDPFWQTHYPPNGWNCRCRVRAMSDRRYKSSGIEATDSEGMLSTKTVDAGTDAITGEVYQTTVTTFNNGKVKMTPEPGWSYNVGSAAFGTDASACQKLVATKDPNLRREFIQTLNGSPARQLDFAVGANQVQKGTSIPNALQSVGFVSENVAAKLNGLFGNDVAIPRLMTINTDQINNLIIATDSTPAALSVQDISALPRIAARPQAVLLDNSTGDLLYVGDTDNSKKQRTIAVAPMLQSAAEKLSTVGIGVNSAGLDELQAALTSGRYKVLEGTL